MHQLLCLLFCARVQFTTITTNEIRTEVRQEEPIYKESARQNANISSTFKGYVSSYNSSYAGCLGCRKYWDEKGQLYYKMANGERLDDNAFTIACNKLPLGTRVSLRNLTNGYSIAADVTDTGGFERLGRIADVTPAVANALKVRTDRDVVEIQAIK